MRGVDDARRGVDDGRRDADGWRRARMATATTMVGAAAAATAARAACSSGLRLRVPVEQRARSCALLLLIYRYLRSMSSPTSIRGHTGWSSHSSHGSLMTSTFTIGCHHIHIWKYTSISRYTRYKIHSYVKAKRG